MLIPLRRHDGSIRAFALVDTIDVGLAGLGWKLDRRGYAVNKRGHRLEELILDVDRRQIRHVNGDRLNSRRSNLRIVEAE